MKRILVVIAMLVVAKCGWTADYVYSGSGASGIWNDAANWGDEGVPGSGDTATVGTTVTFTDDIVIDGDALTIVRNAAVTLNGVISGTGKLVCTGAGAVHLGGANTFSGGLSVSGTCDTSKANDGTGSVYVHHGDALGAGLAELDTKTGPRLHVDGGLTVTTEINFLASNPNNNGYIDFNTAGNVTFKKPVRSNSKMYLTGWKNGEEYFFEDEVKNGEYLFGSGILHFLAPVSFGTYNMSSATPHYHATGNKITNFSFYNTDTYLHAENAVPTSSTHWEFTVAGGKCHMNGFNQEVTSIGSVTWVAPNLQRIGQPLNSTTHGFESPIDQPAVMTFALTQSSLKELWWGVFEGGAGFCWNPTDATSEFIVSNTVQTTRGSVEAKTGIVRVKSGAGFPNLGKLSVDAAGTFVIEPTASAVCARELAVEAGGTLAISNGVSLECVAATIGDTALTDGTYDSSSGYFTGEGTLKVDSHPRNMWIGGAAGEWTEPTNWSLGTVPAADEKVIIADGSVSLASGAATPLYKELQVQAGATLVVSNWNTCVQAEKINVFGTITTPGAFKTGDASGLDNPPCRVWLKCADLTISTGGKIDMDGKGWEGGTYGVVGGTSSPAKGKGWGPGASSDSNFGASHAGYGAMAVVNANCGAPYDDPYAPTYPGSGGWTTYSAAGNKGTDGGGAVRIEATGTVRVNGSILASAKDGGGQPSCTSQWSGSGGSVWITCATFEGNGGEIRADGGDADIGVYPIWIWNYLEEPSPSNAARAGAGGMIRIETGAGQTAATLDGMVVSAGAGIHRGLSDGKFQLTVANQDKYRTEADLGTVTFSDNVLIGQLLGKGLSGRLTGVSAYVHEGDLNWTLGHVSFPGDLDHGADVTIKGNLTLNGGESRLEIGGITNSVKIDVFKTCYAGTHLNKLLVKGDLKLLTGSALDIRAAATNGVDMAWGGEVVTEGDLVVGTGSYLYPWCDIVNLSAPHFTVGGAFTVAEGGTVMADRRGGRGGRGGSAWNTYFGIGATSEKGCGVGRGTERAASHGGLGGKGWSETDGLDDGSANGSVPAVVDDEWTAVYPGAGGGSGGYGEAGQGGGLVCVEAKGAVTVDGLITANGWLGTYTTLGWAKGKDLFVIFGSGAGGGVHLTGASFAGAGTIQAKGGNAISGTVAGTDTAAGKTFKYASACGGGGRVVITTGADVEGKIKILKDLSADWKSDTRVQELNSFNGTIDVAGGVNIWNATNKTGDPLQFEATHGAEGTVRYLRNIPAPGALLMIR